MKRLLTRMTGGIAAAAAVAMLTPSAVNACTRCFGMGVDSAVTQGISMAMAGLLVTLGIVWGGIGMFVYNFRKRSALREPGEWNVNERGEIETSD